MTNPTRNTMLKKAINSALAHIFLLLGIDPGHFGGSGKTGPGALRRQKREAESRKAEALRIKDAAPAQITRQQKRREEAQRVKASMRMARKQEIAGRRTNRKARA
ncbi:MAG: hypothetical protein ACK4NW_12845 [Roseinatronobacter sp.]